MLGLAALSRWDAATCRRLNGINRRARIGLVFSLASRLGDGWVWYALMAALPLAYGAAGAAQALLLALNGASCTALYKMIKRATRRPRPSEVYASLTLTTAPLDRFSFPSGHTLHAVAFTALAVHFYPSLATVLVPFTVVVALSRMVLGLHYPSDVAAGATIGGLSSTLALEAGRALGVPGA
jgi:undecaprenyl-diphosphatase